MQTFGLNWLHDRAGVMMCGQGSLLVALCGTVHEAICGWVVLCSCQSRIGLSQMTAWEQDWLITDDCKGAGLAYHR